MAWSSCPFGGFLFGVEKTRPSVTPKSVEPPAPRVRFFAGNPCRFEASRERGDLARARGHNTSPRDRRAHVAKASSVRRRSLACGMRVASGARLAPRAEQARRGARPTNASDHHRPRRGQRAWRRSVVELGATTRGASVPLPATRPWSSPPRRVRASTWRAEAGAFPARVSPQDPPLAASFDAAYGDRSVDRRTDEVSANPARAASASSRATNPSSPLDPLANERRCLETSDAGTVLGAVALITGSTVGAGALALPATVSPAGIGPSSAVLLGCWGLLVCEALLLAEVNVALMRERDEYRLVHGRGHSPVAISLSEMAGRTLGAEGAAAVTAAYLFLSTTLLTAYVSKSGAIVADVLAGTGVDIDVDPRAASLGFAAALGAALAGGGVSLADKMNQALTATLLSLFGVLIAGGLGRADWSAVDFAGDWSCAPACAPVVFLALVYHDLVPVICAYLAGDVAKIRKAVILGSAAPLAMFLAWDAVALGVGAASGGKGAGSDPLAALMAGGDGTVALVVGGFSFCAIATSFIGTAIGVNAFALPRLERWAEECAPFGTQSRSVVFSESYRRAEKLGMRTLTYVLMLSGPAAIAVTNPDVFLPATNFAGAYGMTAMFGILPPVMAFRMRAQLAEHEGTRTKEASSASLERASRVAGRRSRTTSGSRENEIETSDRNVGGGTPALAALSLAACAITLGQLREDVTRGASLVSSPVGSATLSAERVATMDTAGRFEAAPEAPFASLTLTAPDEAVSATAALAGETRDWFGRAARLVNGL